MLLHVSELLRLNNAPLYVLFIHLSMDGYLYCFYLLAVVNDAAVNISVQVFEFYFGYVLKSHNLFHIKYIVKIFHVMSIFLQN